VLSQQISNSLWASN